MSINVKDELHRKLRVGRANMLANLEGLGDYDLRRPLTPTGTNLLGLVKHLAGLETAISEIAWVVPAQERLSWIEDGSVGEGADMWAQPAESREYVIGLYQRACDHADTTVADLNLDSRGQVPWWSDSDTTLGVCWSGWWRRRPSTLDTLTSCES